MSRISQSDPKQSETDVVIVGGGPIGLALALGLSSHRLRRPLKTVVVEARDPSSFLKQGHDTRGSALSLATQSMFRVLGLLDDLAGDIQDMRRIKVTDGKGALSERPLLLGFLTDDGEPAAAGLIENRLIAKALLQEVDRSPDVLLLSMTALEALTFTTGFAEVELSGGKMIRAPLVVGADGHNSRVRTKAGIGIESKAYQQTALTFSITHTVPHEARAEEHFSRDGVFALLPLKGDRSSVVWATSPAEAERLIGLSIEDFNTELSQKIGTHLGEVRLDSLRQAYPLKQQVAKTSIAHRVALVGDAAHVIHPLAGLGLNLGFKDAAALVDCIHDAVACGEDLGGPQALERYSRWRNFDTVTTRSMINGLNQLFANDDPGLRLLRGLGLQVMNRIDIAKSLFMREAAGVLGDLPRLMRGILPA